ncbi:MAG: bifunctional diaminohydroxyphosphoribosylaminopyrimidine deaminase/5-amino-6-(5-phosphoribosylamino)uracil reductase RibD [Bacteroidales bacterium]|jgi:diaminohydroxyphosphoribosylaminopyrimidine deaminase/5-amino-6-(5-phosphoribosylamino)uracil reductase
MQNANDIKFMCRAIELAELGRGFTNPNPLVGAVIVYNNEIVASGYHAQYGAPHAERDAIQNYINSGRDTSLLSKSTMYVTLEPCNHYGVTPPCTEIIIQYNFKRVVVGLKDPNPKMAGKSLSLLRSKGIEVDLIDNEEILSLLKNQNKIFLKYITTKKPYMLMKVATTLDGKIATHSKTSEAISNELSHTFVHFARHNYAGIMVGKNTVLSDNPSLNCRLNLKNENYDKLIDIYTKYLIVNLSNHYEDNTNKNINININYTDIAKNFLKKLSVEGVKNPVRVIVSSKADLDINFNVFQNLDKCRTLITYLNSESLKTIQTLNEKGVETLLVEGLDNKNVINLESLLVELGKLKIDSILLEGGGNLNFSFLENNLIDEVLYFISPKLVGGKDAISSVEGKGFDSIKDAVLLDKSSIITQYIDGDILISGKILK